MFNTQQFNRVLSIEKPDSGYLVYRGENDRYYFGKNHNDNVVFIINSDVKGITTSYQETSSLIFIFNKKCSFLLDNKLVEEKVHILICKSSDLNRIQAFIRLTSTFTNSFIENDSFDFSKLFKSLVLLFDKERNISILEVQGMFSELYVIKFLSNNKCDIVNYWQSKNKMKFDFSINDRKRIEVKSTIKPIRQHHFIHDQLSNNLYDIKVISVMLQKNDKGITILDLAEEIREMYPNNYHLHLYIESCLGYIDYENLYDIKYDELYLKDNIKIFNGENVPHLFKQIPNGIINVEYDVVLENIIEESIDSLKKWIGEM